MFKTFTTKMLISVVFLTLIAVCSFAGTYNYGEALQKAIYFYECQQAGPLPSWNRVEWRGNSTMTDAVLGGWYDAGDHVKFNLPMSYTASMLGWAEYEYKSAFQSSGQLTSFENNLKFVLDYLANCWDGTNYVYQIGDGNADHNWWGPVEVILKKATPGKRPAASASSNISCVMGQTAAALAIGYKLFGNTTYLTKAKALFAKAAADKSDANYTAANNFYTSWSGPVDEIMWAAIWLYVATNDSTYLSKAESLVPELGTENQSTDIKYKWAHCWDDSHVGALLMLAKLTNKPDYKAFIEKHLDWWVAGGNGKTPGGLSWIDTWGSLRYASTEAFLAFVYSDWSGADSTKTGTYKTFAEKQIDYALGSNERNGSYVVGFGTNAPKHPHHRTAHGSWADSQTVPANHRHTIYGALVGGPSQTGAYTDEIGNYTANEIACDYNAGFVASLAKMYSLYGGTPVSGFPPKETRDDEFFVEACINSTGPNYTEIKALCNNRTGWPARLIKNLGFRYYVDLTEVFNAGYKASDITITTNYVEFPITITLNQLKGNIYYVKVVFTDGTSIFPGGQSEYAGEVQFRIAAPQGTSFWDPKNDYSYQGLVATTAAKTDYIPVYDGDTLLYGKDIGPTTPPTSTPTVGPTSTPTITGDPTPPFILGDVNTDGQVNIIDALLVAQYSVGLPVNIATAAADVNKDQSVNIIDALRIAQFSVGLITSF